MRIISSLIIAFSTYSRIPMPRAEWTDENKKYAMCFFPLIGVIIGLLLWLWLLLCDKLALGPFIRGAVGALLPLFITGGIHMDGLMDTADALASWQSREKRLEILKDSHTGAFAVMTCTGYLLLMAAVLSEMPSSRFPLLLCPFILSRALSAWAMTAFASARPKGMLDSFREPAQKGPVAASSACYLGLAALLLLFSHALLTPFFLGAAGLCLIVYKRMAYRHFGGVTGDLAGWFLQVTELFLLAVIMLGGKIG